MNTVAILITLPLLVIFSYLFDLIARKTKFPAVILLMTTGILARLLVSLTGGAQLDFLDGLIPVLGTIGLILIVLEGALELDISWEKFSVIFKGFVAAAVLLILNIIGIQFFLELGLGMKAQEATMYAIPLSVISSAVAIPSSASLPENEKEFIVYESTFSDILGIMAFNYAVRQFEMNQNLIDLPSLSLLGTQIFAVVVVSILITYALFQLLQNIDHHVKFFLILSLLILVYAIGKIFHLPALVTIFIFGLFLSNQKSLLPSFLKQSIDVLKTEKDLHEFHVLTAESTFLVKTFFFLFFGFSIDLLHFNSIMPFVYGGAIFGIMLCLRYLYFLVTTFKLKPSSVTYITPRGLISILLFLQLGKLPFLESTGIVIDAQVLLVVILLSMLVMTRGTMQKKKKEVFDFGATEFPTPDTVLSEADSSEEKPKLENNDTHTNL